ncbi:ABC transporter ATP-binding protein, partial [bacterium 1XD42-8]
MGKLLRYLQGYKRESILGPLFKLLEAGFELFVPLVMADIIDIGIQNKDLPYIWKMGGILVALGGIGLICSITAQYFAAKAAVGFGTKLRKDLFAHIMKLSYTEIDTIGSSTFITRMTSDINQVQSGVNLVLRLFLRSPFIVFGAMVMAFTIDRKSALVFVVAIPLLSMVVFGILFVSMPLYKKVQKQLDLVLRTTRENLTGARVIRAFHKEKEEIEGFEKDSDLLSKLQIFVGKISALLNPITYILIQGAVIALVWIGGKQVYYGSITQGEVIALINYMSQILVELVKLANLMITI